MTTIELNNESRLISYYDRFFSEELFDQLITIMTQFAEIYLVQHTSFDPIQIVPKLVVKQNIISGAQEAHILEQFKKIVEAAENKSELIKQAFKMYECESGTNTTSACPPLFQYVTQDDADTEKPSLTVTICLFPQWYDNSSKVFCHQIVSKPRKTGSQLKLKYVQLTETEKSKTKQSIPKKVEIGLDTHEEYNFCGTFKRVETKKLIINSVMTKWADTLNVAICVPRAGPVFADGVSDWLATTDNNKYALVTEGPFSAVIWSAYTDQSLHGPSENLNTTRTKLLDYYSELRKTNAKSRFYYTLYLNQACFSCATLNDTKTNYASQFIKMVIFLCECVQVATLDRFVDDTTQKIFTTEITRIAKLVFEWHSSMDKLKANEIKKMKQNQRILPYHIPFLQLAVREFHTYIKTQMQIKYDVQQNVSGNIVLYYDVIQQEFVTPTTDLKLTNAKTNALFPVSVVREGTPDNKMNVTGEIETIANGITAAGLQNTKDKASPASALKQVCAYLDNINITPDEYKEKPIHSNPYILYPVSNMQAILYTALKDVVGEYDYKTDYFFRGLQFADNTIYTDLKVDELNRYTITNDIKLSDFSIDTVTKYISAVKDSFEINTLYNYADQDEIIGIQVPKGKRPAASGKGADGDESNPAGGGGAKAIVGGTDVRDPKKHKKAI